MTRVAMTRGMPRGATRSMFTLLAAGGLGLALAAAPAHAQPAEKAGGSEVAKATANAASAAGESGEPGEAESDPSQHFNFVGLQPGNLFDYRGKDELGGPLGDGKMTDPATGQTMHEEEAASPPFVFVLVNFAILLALLLKL